VRAADGGHAVGDHHHRAAHQQVLDRHLGGVSDGGGGGEWIGGRAEGGVTSRVR
jgi:hypothetical protein